jgi:hypothetical protein
MSQPITIPEHVESALRKAWGANFDRAVLEALVMEAYRRGDVSIGFCGEVLGLGVIGALDFMHAKEVHQPFDPAQIEQDAKVIEQILREEDLRKQRGSSAA